MGRSRRGEPIDGLLLLDKPVGPTSHAACERVRRALGAQKAGHTGTLDPLASGLLEICLGRATRLVPYLMADSKTYEAVLRLGQATDTLDAEGQVVAEAPPGWAAAVEPAAFAAALGRFEGEQQQRPPAYSAIKVDGRRLHALARAGEAVEAPLRSITVHAIELVQASPPDFRFRVCCGKGTYIRSLGRDIAETLGGHGHLVGLRRISNGARSVANAIDLDQLEANPGAARQQVLPLAEAVGHLPILALDARALDDVRHGRPFRVADAVETPLGRVLDAQGLLVALARVEANGHGVVERGFAAAG